MKRYIHASESVNNKIDFIVIVNDARTFSLSQMPIVATSQFEDYDSYGIDDLAELDVTELRTIESPYALDLLQTAINSGELDYKLTKRQREILSKFYQDRENSDVFVDSVGVQELLSAIKQCNTIIGPTIRNDQPEKNFALMHRLPMQPDDYLAIIHNLKPSEFTGALKSANEKRLGVVLYEFIHNPNGYKLKYFDTTISDDIKIYVKLIPDYNSKYTVTVISFHDPLDG